MLQNPVIMLLFVAHYYAPEKCYYAFSYGSLSSTIARVHSLQIIVNTPGHPEAAYFSVCFVLSKRNHQSSHPHS